MIFRKSKTVCKAASYSLLFQPSGEVLSCHYNRGYILGRYPENSIQAIWNSKKRKSLLKSLHKKQFNLGCFACKNDMDQGLNHLVGKNKYNYIEAANTKLPASMEFQLDNLCNLECIMCSGEYSSGIRKHREKGQKYISPYDDKFVEQLDSFIPALKHVSFTGGEPFLFDIYYKIWDRFAVLNPNCHIYISTNGTVLNSRVKKYLEQLNFNLTISIDSLNIESYEAIRKNAVLEKTMENIDFFTSYCKQKNTTINIKCLVMPQNYKDIPSLISFFSSRNTSVFPKIAMIPAFASFQSLPRRDIEEVMFFFKNQTFSQNNETQINNRLRFEELISQIENIDRGSDSTTVNMEMDVEKIKNIFEQKMFTHMDNLDNNILKDKEYYSKVLLQLYGSIEKEAELKMAIINFSKLPPEILLNEINRFSIEKLVSRFKQVSEFGEFK